MLHCENTRSPRSSSIEDFVTFDSNLTAESVEGAELRFVIFHGLHPAVESGQNKGPAGVYVGEGKRPQAWVLPGGGQEKGENRRSGIIDENCRADP